jgi:hypothetical protein
VKRYWQIIANNFSKAGWTWGCVATVDRDGRTIFVADAHRGDLIFSEPTFSIEHE